MPWLAELKAQLMCTVGARSCKIAISAPGQEAVQGKLLEKKYSRKKESEPADESPDAKGQLQTN